VKREFGSLIEVHRAERPAANPEARYNRALQQLSVGDVDQALAETMRLPGAARASDWTDKARRYVAAQRALDEIETAALLTRPNPGG
jgi:predicted Zn-dependent protease